jgi:hypothetical protein
MNNESRTRLIKKGAIWGFILFELVFFSIAGSYLVAVGQRLHGSRQHAAAAQAVGAHRDHRAGHDDHHDQRQHRPERRGDLCAGGNRDARQHDLAGLLEAMATG